MVRRPYLRVAESLGVEGRNVSRMVTKNSTMNRYIIEQPEAHVPGVASVALVTGSGAIHEQFP